MIQEGLHKHFSVLTRWTKQKGEPEKGISDLSSTCGYWGQSRDQISVLVTVTFNVQRP